MKKEKVIILLSFLGLLSSCGVTRVEDTRNLSDIDFTINNLVATDEYGRQISLGGVRDQEKEFGLFYHIWHGHHNEGIYNITELERDNPEALWNPAGTSESPLNKFHYWGEPLYGYYNSADPWVTTRHIELFVMAGVDYLVYDLTNSVIYTPAINAMFATLDKFHQQGFKVPKVAFYTNSGSGNTIVSCYRNWYKPNSYPHLWYSLDGKKPLIIGKSGDIKTAVGGDMALADEITNFFQIKESNWPDATRQDLENGFPWMSWTYPQDNFDGVMSVSLAQHSGMRMSEKDMSNQGRGFDYSIFSNDSPDYRSGSNFQGQWDTAHRNKDKVNNVFMTGFNEWIAIKYADGAGRVYFVDTFNEEYSRDIEMSREGYGDNFYLQMIQNMRKFGWSESEHFKYDMHTIDIFDNSLSGWNDVKANYIDLSGDAIARNFISADKINNLVDNSNRNDIVSTKVTHDKNNLYIKVETKETITAKDANDKSWMNIMISTEKNDDNFAGYDYIINQTVEGQKSSVSRLKKDYSTTKVGEADINVKGNVLQVKIPLKLLNKKANDCQIAIKIVDNIQNPSDILDYYVTGDSAPIGRLGYSYGY